MKPMGISVGLSDNGPVMHVTGNGRVENIVWDAVADAMEDGWTLKQIVDEVKQAYEYERKEQLRRELREVP
jgi:hypothetical protein